MNALGNQDGSDGELFRGSGYIHILSASMKVVFCMKRIIIILTCYLARINLYACSNNRLSRVLYRGDY